MKKVKEKRWILQENSHSSMALAYVTAVLPLSKGFNAKFENFDFFPKDLLVKNLRFFPSPHFDKNFYWTFWGVFHKLFFCPKSALTKPCWKFSVQIIFKIFKTFLLFSEFFPASRFISPICKNKNENIPSRIWTTLTIASTPGTSEK